MKIKKIQADLSQDTITCDITLDGEYDDVQFAYYIYKNDKRIFTRWYSSQPHFVFNTEGAPGYYRVVGFIKFGDDKFESARSNPIFFSPVEVSPSSLHSSNPENITFKLKGRRWSFPALYHRGSSKSLLVMMPSAIDRSKTSLPAFSRWTWVAEGILPGHVLCISDPTLELNPNLNLGWLIGDKKNDATKDLADFVKKFAKCAGIPNEKIVVYGSGAGGFAALALAACIEGSTAVAINAQTDILSYEISSKVSLIQKYCFDELDRDEIRKNFRNRVEMVARWKSATKSRAFLVQNDTDIHHYNVHFLPFWKSLKGTAAPGVRKVGKHIAWVYHQEGGHIPESKEMALEIISMLKLR